MADNVTLNTNTTTGAIVATDEVGGAQFQRIKVTVGGDGVAADASVAAPLPVRISNGAAFCTTKNPGAEIAMSVAIVDGAGNQVTSFGGAGGTSATDDSTFTAGSGTGTPIMGFATADAVDANDVGVVGMTTARELYTTLRTAIPAGNNNIGDVDIVTLPAVTGSAAVDAALTGNPVPVAGRASTAVPTAVSADNDVQIPWLTRNGSANVVIRDTAGDSAMDDTNNAIRATIVSGSIAGIVDDSAFTAGTTEVLPVGYFADETATDSVDEGDMGAARMTLDRKQIVTKYVHAAAGGSSSYSSISTAAVLSAVIKASPGKVFSIQVFNINAAARFVRLYNQTGAPASTDGANILWRGIIPGSTTGAGFQVKLDGAQYSTGIGIRASTGIADNDTGALAANELTFNVEYA